MPVFEKTTSLPMPAKEVYKWHISKGAFRRLVPPWDNIEVVYGGEDGISEGEEVLFKIIMPFINQGWKALHHSFKDGEEFTDEQLSGPFSKWVHRHRFLPDGDDDCILKDQINYKLYLNAISEPLMGWYFHKYLERMFHFRTRQLEKDFARHSTVKDKKRVKAAITGASGVIGSALGLFLQTGGHDVFKMVRREPGSKQNEIKWDPAKGVIDREALSGMDAVVHLAGENLAGGKWTPQKKEAILKSRMEGTRLLCETLANLDDPPKVLIAASAIGYYGDCEEGVTCSEDHEEGEGFLSEVCGAWEGATQPAKDAGIRVVNMRIGVVLSLRGGALKQMILPFKMGLGGRVGSGKQVLSWVALDDVIGAIHHMIYNEDIAGPVNVVSPTPVSNNEFTKTLARVLKRPAIMPLPESLIRLIYGEMGDMVLMGSRVEPGVLKDNGFEFFYNDLENCLRDELGIW
jgi:uncharacterized protein